MSNRKKVGTGTTSFFNVEDGTALNIFLTNEMHIVPALSDGTVTNLTGATTQIKVYKNGEDVTSTWTFSVNAFSGLTGTISGNSYTVTGMTSDSAYVDIKASKSGYDDVIKRFSLNKSKAGSDGSDAFSINLIASSQFINTVPGEFNEEDDTINTIFVPATVIIEAEVQNTTVGYWGYSINEENTFLETNPPGVTREGNVITIDSSLLESRSLTIRAGVSEGDPVYDQVTIIKTIDINYIDNRIVETENKTSTVVETVLESEEFQQELDKKIGLEDFLDRLEQMRSQTNDTVSLGTGKNLIRNSAALKGMDFWSYDGDDPIFIRRDRDLTEIGLEKCFYSAAGGWQEASLIQGGLYDVLRNETKYTVSFYLKKYESSGDGALTVIFHNGGTDVNYLTIPAEYQTNGYERFHFTIENIKTAVVDACYLEIIFGAEADISISGIMVNEGEIPFAWTPHENELYNSKVFIDEDGILVRGEGNVVKIATQINEEGFLVKKQNMDVATQTVESEEEVFSVNGDIAMGYEFEVSRKLNIGEISFVRSSSSSGKNGIAIIRKTT